MLSDRAIYISNMIKQMTIIMILIIIIIIITLMVIIIIIFLIILMTVIHFIENQSVNTKVIKNRKYSIRINFTVHIYIKNSIKEIIGL